MRRYGQLPNLLGLIISQNSQGFCNFQGLFLIERHSKIPWPNAPMLKAHIRTYCWVRGNLLFLEKAVPTMANDAGSSL